MTLPKVLLVRTPTTDQGTFGLLQANQFRCHVLELPWRDNRRQRSCIPVGSYDVLPHMSGRFGRCYWVQDVPGRSGILFHGGNYAGDVDLGWKSHSYGCLLLGRDRGILDGQAAVLYSLPTVRGFLDYMQWKPFHLVIEGV